MPPVNSVKEVFELMPSRFLPDKAAGVNAVIQFDLTGEGGGQYYVSITDGICTTAEGTAPNPNMTLTGAAADYLGIVRGEINPMQAFMQGKVKVKGDMGLALKMQQMFMP